MIPLLINNKTPRTLMQSKRRQAFSLVELLVVIAVIAIIAAIAIPNTATITDTAKASKDRRNAQSIASVYRAARAAGHPADASFSDAIAVVTGDEPIEVEVGAETLSFSVDGISQAEINFLNDPPVGEGAARYLSWDTARGVLIYEPDGVAAADGDDDVAAAAVD